MIIIIQLLCFQKHLRSAWMERKVRNGSVRGGSGRSPCLSLSVSVSVSVSAVSHTWANTPAYTHSRAARTHTHTHVRARARTAGKSKLYIACVFYHNQETAQTPGQHWMPQAYLLTQPPVHLVTKLITPGQSRQLQLYRVVTPALTAGLAATGAVARDG